jgi:hypothetical protein
MCFEEFLNQKPIESNFEFLAVQKSFPVLFLFFISVLAHQYPFSYLSGPSHTLSQFFASPVSSSTQPRIQSTGAISFGHLRPPNASRCRLWPPRPSRRSSLCHPPPAPWSHLTITSASPFPSPVTSATEVPLSPPPSARPPAFLRPTAL